MDAFSFEEIFLYLSNGTKIVFLVLFSRPQLKLYLIKIVLLMAEHNIPFLLFYCKLFVKLFYM